MDTLGHNDNANFGDKTPLSANDLHLDNPEAAIALVSCSPDSDYAEMVSSLSASLRMPIAGLTSVGIPFDIGEEAFGTHVTLIGKKNTKRSLAVSDVLEHTRSRELMADLHKRCLDGLEGEPKLYLLFMPILPNLYADDYLDRLFELLGDVPVVGGMASDDFRSERTAAFGNDAAYKDRMVLVALSGDVRPAFGVGCEFTNPSSFSPVVTEADGNLVRRVDDMLFSDYMNKLGFGPDATTDFPLSIRIRAAETDDDDYPRVSSIVAMNDDGSGTLSTNIEVGATISVGYVNQANIASSTQSAVDRLKASMSEIEKDGYRFDTLFVVSCVGRYYTMVEQPNVEAHILDREMTPDLAGFGFYAFREVGPVPGADGRLKNQRHGQSLVLCAI
ncbi:MAG: FIST C-terminal domain-containing protein [Planctomycetaceae bacterium]|nr:FIST C-terminal domain-containing protein [Planctomycetaceae bacterium]